MESFKRLLGWRSPSPAASMPQPAPSTTGPDSKQDSKRVAPGAARPVAPAEDSAPSHLSGRVVRVHVRVPPAGGPAAPGRKAVYTMLDSAYQACRKAGVDHGALPASLAHRHGLALATLLRSEGGLSACVEHVAQWLASCPDTLNWLFHKPDPPRIEAARVVLLTLMEMAWPPQAPAAGADAKAGPAARDEPVADLPKQPLKALCREAVARCRSLKPDAEVHQWAKTDPMGTRVLIALDQALDRLLVQRGMAVQGRIEQLTGSLLLPSEAHSLGVVEVGGPEAVDASAARLMWALGTTQSRPLARAAILERMLDMSRGGGPLAPVAGRFWRHLNEWPLVGPPHLHRVDCAQLLNWPQDDLACLGPHALPALLVEAMAQSGGGLPGTGPLGRIGRALALAGSPARLCIVVGNALRAKWAADPQAADRAANRIDEAFRDATEVQVVGLDDRLTWLIGHAGQAFPRNSRWTVACFAGAATRNDESFIGARLLRTDAACLEQRPLAERTDLLGRVAGTVARRGAGDTFDLPEWLRGSMDHPVHGHSAPPAPWRLRDMLWSRMRDALPVDTPPPQPAAAASLGTAAPVAAPQSPGPVAATVAAPAEGLDSAVASRDPDAAYYPAMADFTALFAHNPATGLAHFLAGEVAGGRGASLVRVLPLAQEAVALFERQHAWLAQRHGEAPRNPPETLEHLHGALEAAGAGLRQGIVELDQAMAGMDGEQAAALRHRLAALRAHATIGAAAGASTSSSASSASRQR